MPDFHYVARTQDGQKKTGTIESASQQEAALALSARGLFPTELSSTSGDSGNGVRIRRISGELKATTIAQLADLLRSGVPMMRSIQVLRNQTSHAGLNFVLGEVARHVEDGETLADAMRRYPKVFGEMEVSMIRAGSEGGFLEDALEQVAAFVEAQDELKKRIIGALVYPCILAIVMTVVITALVVFFVPKFETVFDSLRQRGELPFFTEALLAMSSRMLYILPTGLVMLGGFYVWLKQITKSEGGRFALDRFKLKIPMAGPLYESFAVARFCRILGTLLGNGVPILRSLNIAADASGNRVLQKAINQATENISSGARLAEPLAASGSFPQPVVEMIGVAEESNTLDHVLTNIATKLEKNAWRKLDIVVRMLEPLMLVVLAGIVLMLVIALMMPMFKMSQTI